MESVDYEFAADAKLEEATIDTDIKDVPGPPTNFQPGAEDVCV